MGPITISGIAWIDVLLVAMGAWGYLAAFLGGALENIFIAGSFVPGETVVMIVAAAASRDPHVSIWLVWLASVLGTVAGSTISYMIGRTGGRPLLVAIVGKHPRLTKGLEDAERYFEIHGTKTVFLARFTAGFKNFTPTLAGVTRMSLAPFELYTVLSAIVYSTGLVLLGHFFGQNLRGVLRWMNRAGLWAVVAVVLLAGAYFGYRRWKASRIDRQIIDLEVEKAELELLDDGFEPTGGEEDDEGV